MIRFSWAKSREILFPFDFKRWFKILIIVWLAGAGVQGCNANFRSSKKPATPSSSAGVFQPASTVTREGVGTVSSAGGTSGALVTVKVPAAEPSPSEGKKQVRSSTSKPDLKKLGVFIVPGVILGLAIMLFFMWLSSRFSFILLDVIVMKHEAIKDRFREYREIGNSYFKWSLAFFGIMLGTLAIVGLIGVGLLGVAKGHAGLGILFGITMGLLGLVVLLGMIVTGMTVRDLVLPIMYREKIPAMVALNKFLDSDTFAFGKVFQYLLVILGLGILASIVQSLVSLIAAIGGLIAGGIAVIPGFLLVKTVPVLKFPLLILGIFVIVMVILAVIVAASLLMLPVAIFFRVFALVYLTRLYPDCDLMGFVGREP